MSDVAALEKQLSNAKELIERRQMALRLFENRDFRKLCLDDYTVTEAARLIQLGSDPSLTKEQQSDAISMALATGHFKRFMSMTVQMGAHSEHDLPNIEAALDEARAEDLLEQSEVETL